MENEHRLIYVCGTPSGGTSAVAGILHHLGVDMGEPLASVRHYCTFEDRRCQEYTDTPTPAQEFIMGEGRDFRGYISDRLKTAKPGQRVGVKIGSAYWLGDREPASLPLDIVKVDRPLEASIRSDWQYKLAASSDRTQDYQALRTAQMAGYWQAKETLCELIAPRVQVPFGDLLRVPHWHVNRIIEALDLEVSDDQRYAAVNSVSQGGNKDGHRQTAR